MEICSEWLDDAETVYLIRIRGLWKNPDVNDYLTNLFTTNTTARYIIFDPTDAMLPSSLINPPKPWPLDDALAKSIQRCFLQPHFQRYVRVVNNDLPYFETSLNYFGSLGVRHKVHHVNSLEEAQAFVASNQRATGPT